MNQPIAPRNDLFDVLTIYNPSDQEFPVYYNSELHAIIQPHKAIQLVKMIAGDDENGAIKHLVDRMCRLSGKQKNDPAVRSAWLNKIVIKQTSSKIPGVVTLEDQAKAINRDLAEHPIDMPVAPYLPSIATPPTSTQPNPKWKFDPETGKPITKAPVITPESVDVSHVEIQPSQDTIAVAPGVPPIATPSHPNPETDAILQGIRSEHAGEDGERVIGEATPPSAEAPYVPTKNWPDSPTQEDLIRYAKNVVMMNVSDEKTLESLKSQSIEELKSTLKYDVFA